ncbi:MAG: hypothetical protein KAW92_10600 [Candidatus Cloacimonetes bacterium]|nr:hypothetical protein [Candidatus Cloacimonadota bacterium]
MRISRKTKLTYEVEVDLHAHCNEEEMDKMLEKIREEIKVICLRTTARAVKKESRGSYIFRVENVRLKSSK